MSWSLALNIGDAFAEVIAFRDQQRLHHRWFLPSQQFPKNLIDWLSTHDIQSLRRVRICTNWAQTILQRQLCSPPVFLTTSGFEGWLEMTALKSHLIDPNRVLGVNERAAANGKILSSPTSEDIEFLISKLKLLKAKSVALGFLHSPLNPTNEDFVATALREAGFQVFKSHEIKSVSQDELERWQMLLERTAVDELFMEWKDRLLGALTPFLEEGSACQILTSLGLKDFASDVNPMETTSGPCQAAFDGVRQKDRELLATYYGFDEWVDQKLGSLAVQPLQAFKAGVFGYATLDSKTVQYETGPMGWGRGQNITVMDILWRGQQLAGPPEILQRFTDRGQRRVEETLLTLSRPLVSEERVSAEFLLELVTQDLKAHLRSLSPRVATGPLAASLVALLPEGTSLKKSAEGYESCLGLFEELQ